MTWPVDGSVLSILQKAVEVKHKHSGILNWATSARNAHSKLAKSSAQLECPSTFGQLGQYLAQCCDITVLQMRT